MDKIELQIKQNEDTVIDIAEKIELASNTINVTKEEILQKMFGNDVVKPKTISFAGQTFIQYEKELDESNQINKSYENYIGDEKIKNDVLNKVFEKKLKENVNWEKDKYYKNIFYHQIH